VDKTAGTIMNYYGFFLIAVMGILFLGVVQYCFHSQSNPVHGPLKFNTFILWAATLLFAGEIIDYLIHFYSATTRRFPSPILLVVIAILLSNRSRLKNRLGEKDELN
jgi:hypothetical protein